MNLNVKKMVEDQNKNEEGKDYENLNENNDIELNGEESKKK